MYRCHLRALPLIIFSRFPISQAAKQPVINGYLIAGALVGPGGLGLIKELVQVRVSAMHAHDNCNHVTFMYSIAAACAEYSVGKTRTCRDVCQQV